MNTFTPRIALASLLALWGAQVGAQEVNIAITDKETNATISRNAEFINNILSSRADDEFNDDYMKEQWRNNTERLAKSALPWVKSLRWWAKWLVYPLFNYVGTTVSAWIYRIDGNKWYNNQFNQENGTTNFGLIAEIPLWK
jgi:hypothetical protein